MRGYVLVSLVVLIILACTTPQTSTPAIDNPTTADTAAASGGGQSQQEPTQAGDTAAGDTGRQPQQEPTQAEGAAATDADDIGPSFTSVSAGFFHTCGVKSDGSAVCWGSDREGQATPPDDSFVSVSAGQDHTCGVTTDGSVVCWGSDRNRKATPPDGSFSSVSAGTAHTCGVKTDGSVVCWGYNVPKATEGRFPDGLFTSVSPGGSLSCGLRGTGKVACWRVHADKWSAGLRLTGLLEDLVYTSISVGGRSDDPYLCAVRADNGSVNCFVESPNPPARYVYDRRNRFEPPDGPFTSVTAGRKHACGLRVDGSVVCWGIDEYGQATPPADSFVSVSAGTNHTCGVTTDGSVVCWGSNSSGQAMLHYNFSSVSAGTDHTCGVTTDGSAVCWGSDQDGQAAPPDDSFVSVSAGTAHTCGVTTDGSASCWGNDDWLQATSPDGSFSSISAGGSHTCGMKADGSVVCWGKNSDGQVTPPDSSFSFISAGQDHTCGVTTDGNAACWGNGEYDQAAAPDGSFVSVSAGTDHTCGVTTDGSAVCWGSDQDGQAVPPDDSFVSVSAGTAHTCGVTTDGSVVCWGSDQDRKATPPDDSFVSVSAGTAHTCGVTTDGSPSCWGIPTLVGARPAPTTPISAEAELVPENPETNDEILLQDIYAQIDLEQFALDPGAEILRPDGERWDPHTRPHRGIFIHPYTETRNHPYLHLLPGLKYIAENEGTVPEFRGETFVTSTSIHNELRYDPIKNSNPKFFYPRDPITNFIYHPWFETIERHDGDFAKGKNGIVYRAYGPHWFGENSTRGVLSEAVAKALGDNTLAAAEPMQLPWSETHDGELVDRTWKMDEYIRTTLYPKGIPIGSSAHAAYGTPRTHWEFLHPRLPILKITSYGRTVMPLKLPGQEKRDRKSTVFAVSFVIAFQNRWDSFDNPNRWLVRFEEDLKRSKNPRTGKIIESVYPDKLTPVQGAIDEETHKLFPNYWHGTDYMQHSIIGPVVVQVYQSEVIQPGLYAITPKVTRWEAPGHIASDEQLKTLEWFGSIELDNPALRLGADPGSPNVNWPLPGHVMTDANSAPGTDLWEEFIKAGSEW